MATLRENLRQLSEAVGVSGGEHEVRQLILGLIKDHVSDVVIDPMGNVTAVRKGTGESPLRVMVSAHMDEPGFMLTKVGEDGLISMVSVGAHDARFAPSKRVLVGSDKTPGVLLWTPIHKSADNDGVIAVSDLQVDIGAESKGGVKAKPGERIAFVGAYAELGTAVARGKAFGSRAACAVLIELLAGGPFAFDLHAAFTAQQAIGGRGAAVASHRIDPHAAFVLRGTECNDLPRDDDEDRTPVVRLGAGPAITVVDPSLISNRRLVEHVLNTARSAGIPHQMDAQNVARSEGGAINLARAGLPVAVVGVPVRYLASPNGLVNFDDLECTVRLMRESLAALTPEVLEG